MTMTTTIMMITTLMMAISDVLGSSQIPSFSQIWQALASFSTCRQSLFVPFPPFQLLPHPFCLFFSLFLLQLSSYMTHGALQHLPLEASCAWEPLAYRGPVFPSIGGFPVRFTTLSSKSCNWFLVPSGDCKSCNLYLSHDPLHSPYLVFPRPGTPLPHYTPLTLVSMIGWVFFPIFSPCVERPLDQPSWQVSRL
jgi:hypothetical protein